MKTKKMTWINAFVCTLLCITCATAQADFVIGVMPDTQNLADSNNDQANFNKMTQFFVDMKASGTDLIMVISVGDMTQNDTTTQQPHQDAT